MQSLYLYFNEEDLQSLFSSIDVSDTAFFDSKGNKVDSLPAIGDSPSTYVISGKNSETMYFIPCHYINKSRSLYSGVFFSDCDCSSKENQMFRSIKKYVKKHYLYNKRYCCYIGTGAYDDWLKRKYVYSIPLDFSMVTVSSNSINHIFNEAKRRGFYILPNNVRLRDINVLDLQRGSFIIHPQSANILKTTLRKSYIRYEYDSECIFVEKDEKKAVYAFILDKRLQGENYNDILQFFNYITQFSQGIT